MTAVADKKDQDDYAAAAAEFNPLVPKLRAAREAGDAAEVERLRAIMGPLDLTMRRTQASVNTRSIKAGSDAAKAKDAQRFADMPVGARVRPSEFPNGNIFWGKQADNQWAGTGGPLEGKTATDAGLADRGGLVAMPAGEPVQDTAKSEPAPKESAIARRNRLKAERETPAPAPEPAQEPAPAPVAPVAPAPETEPEAVAEPAPKPARSPETQQVIDLRKRRSVLQSLKECLA